MSLKKNPEPQEPLLNAVARKLGYAAGTLTNVAQGITENLSVVPQAVSKKVRTAASKLGEAQHRPKQQKTKHRAARKRTQRTAATARKRNQAGSKSPRRARSKAGSKKR